MIGGNLIKDIIKEERPRETLLKKGETYLSDSELLAILINNGTRDKSAITLAREIIETSDGIRNLSNITVEELSKIKGIGLAKACRIISALELGRRVSVASEMQKFKISSPQDIGNVYMEELRYKKKEIFRVVLLNTKNVIIGRNCWIASNVIILPGTRIGEHCVIGANCTVRGELKDNTLMINSGNAEMKSIME